MGMDFVALMKYGGPDGRLLRVLDRLEAGSPAEVQALTRLMRERAFATGHEATAVWEFMYRTDLRDPRLGRRPRLPSLAVALHLPEDFFLTFGPDAIEVYHLLRWHFFLTEPDLQRTMLDACLCLGRLFGATACVVTSDFSPVIQAFRQGQGFDASLSAAGPEDGERPTLADLYREDPEDYVLREVTLPDGRRRARYRDWDRGQPPPEGWERATTWDSKGFWRLDLGPGLPTGIEPAEILPAGRPRRTATVPDESGWATCEDPDAMLDLLLKQEEVIWRKVRLWACACVRRIWPRLAREPVRRAIEVAELFADERATGPEVERVVRAAAQVKRGDRRANRAAGLLAEFCSGTSRFPPGDISQAVIDAVVGQRDDPAATAAERKAHADLLRDIFGPHPLRPINIDLTWRTPAVLALARATCQGRELPSGLIDPVRMAVLADALEEAGAIDQELLGHLRGPGPHVAGCFALDAILGKS